MAVTANAQDAASNWVTGMSGATAKYTAGINAVRVAPGQLAAAASGRWAANVAAAQQKFAANVAKVTLQAWQSSATTKGAPRLASGAQAAQPKMAAFMTAFIPALTSVVQGLPAGGTFEANVNRATAYMNALHAQKGNF